MTVQMHAFNLYLDQCLRFNSIQISIDMAKCPTSHSDLMHWWIDIIIWQKWWQSEIEDGMADLSENDSIYRVIKIGLCQSYKTWRIRMILRSDYYNYRSATIMKTGASGIFNTTVTRSAGDIYSWRIHAFKFCFKISQYRIIS